jgi:hypothetical protein
VVVLRGRGLEELIAVGCVFMKFARVWSVVIEQGACRYWQVRKESTVLSTSTYAACLMHSLVVDPDLHGRQAALVRLELQHGRKQEVFQSSSTWRLVLNLFRFVSMVRVPWCVLCRLCQDNA